MTESAGAEETVGQVVVPRQRNVKLPFSGARLTRGTTIPAGDHITGGATRSVFLTLVLAVLGFDLHLVAVLNE